MSFNDFHNFFNIPVIVLTNDCLKNNFWRYTIEWNDITELQLFERGNGSFANLAINLKDPDKYFNSPIKKTIYNIKQLFSVNDILIRVDFIAGSNEEIFEVMKAFWTKNSDQIPKRNSQKVTNL
jgi:hypothetical protein